MADQREGGIAWTDETWNPLRGCSRKSPGCFNCYAEKVALRFSGPGQPYEGLVHMVNGKPTWTGVIKTVEDHLLDPLRWQRPRSVFVNSMSDLFHEDVPDQFIVDVFAVMVLAHWHQFQVLTKRIERARDFLLSGDHGIVDQFTALRTSGGVAPRHVFKALDIKRRDNVSITWPPPNVRVGPSIENQTYADRRFPYACDLAEAGWDTIVSLEPLLGPVVVPDRYLAVGRRGWLIPGGESSDGARPCDINWIRAIARQASAAGMACLVKQLGTLAHDGYITALEILAGSPGIPRPAGQELTEEAAHAILKDEGVLEGAREFRRWVATKNLKGGDPLEWPEDLRAFRQFPEAA